MLLRAALAAALATAPPEVKPDVPYVPTPPEVVAAMVKLAGVRAGDVVYDLGCGDGRIVIAAVQVKGVRGVCVDIDPERIHESRQNAQIAGVADRIRFVEGDLFEVPIEGASVVMIYLLPEVNLRLRPRLLAELRPGTRIVSHRFDLGDWKAQRRVAIPLPPYDYILYRWVVPMRRARPAS
jgi:23S rRNA G2445 N2-methylase RlmL